MVNEVYNNLRRLGIADWNKAGRVKRVSRRDDFSDVNPNGKASRNYIFTEADEALDEGRSKGKNVSDTILKHGLDYLIESVRNGEEDSVEKIHDALGRVYSTDAKYTWHSDYQQKAMDAMKEGGLF